MDKLVTKSIKDKLSATAYTNVNSYIKKNIKRYLSQRYDLYPVFTSSAALHDSEGK